MKPVEVMTLELMYYQIILRIIL